MSDPLAAMATMIGSVLSSTANAISVAATKSDPHLLARLQKLNGRCIEIHCTAPDVAWHLQIDGGVVNVYSGSALTPHVSVSGSAMDLASWLLPDGASRSTSIRIEGDQVSLDEFMQALRAFRPDFAEPFSQFLGSQVTDSNVASRILGGAEIGLQGLRSAVEGLSKSFERPDAKYVRQEELESILGGIDELRLRMDRLAAEFAQAQKEAADPTQSQPADSGKENTSPGHTP